MSIKYKLEKKSSESEASSITKLIDTGIAINFSIDPDSTSYQEYLAWVAEGNTVEAAD